MKYELDGALLDACERVKQAALSSLCMTLCRSGPFETCAGVKVMQQIIILTGVGVHHALLNALRRVTWNNLG